MTVSELIASTGYRVVSLPEPNREINGVYVGDLLSWVMGRASEDNVWITIMTNLNVVAVASLADVSVVILCEDCVPEESVIETAKQKSVNIIVSNKPIYETCLAINGAIK